MPVLSTLMSTEQVLKEYYGPNWVSPNWSKDIRNIRTGAISSLTHHCDFCGAPKTRRCFEELHYVYCKEWVVLPDGPFARCSEVLCLRSKGCALHPFTLGFNDKFRKLKAKGSLGERLVLKPPVDGSSPPLDPAQERREDNARLLEEADHQIEAAVEAGQSAAATENAYQAFNTRKKIQEAELRARRKKDQEVAQRTARQEDQRRRENKLASRYQTFKKKVVGNRKKEELREREEVKERKRAKEAAEAQATKAQAHSRIFRRG